MIDDNSNHKIDMVSADEKIRQEAWTREKTLNDYYSDMFNAREEGIQEGIQEGIEIGFEIGRKKVREKTIEAMKKLGYSQEDIDKAIGIS